MALVPQPEPASLYGRRLDEQPGSSRRQLPPTQHGEVPENSLVSALKQQALESMALKKQRAAERQAAAVGKKQEQPVDNGMALILHGHPSAPDEDDKPQGNRIGYSESESSEDEAQREAGPGPLDPERCSASGTGFSGGSAGLPVKLVIYSKDEAGRRVKEGGAHVRVWVEPASMAQDAEPVEAAVTDHADGSYSATYSVAGKGNYNVRSLGGEAA